MKTKTNITILAVETSCDDTGIAIIKTPIKNGGDFNILSNIVSSQTEIHKKYGGVYPMMAKREHQRNLLPVLIRALRESKLLKTQNSSVKRDSATREKLKTIKKILEREKDLQRILTSFLKKYQKPNIGLIAVTNGPGLEPCLWVGVNFAKALSYFWNIPIVQINHIEAHILVNFLPKINEISNFHWTQSGLPEGFFPISNKFSNSNFQTLMPAVCLVVSGGHTQLILMRDFGKYKILGETRDDAGGECFDKTARILGLGYPGGPAVAEQASKSAEFGTPRTRGVPNSVKLPRPMINTKDYDFSFSGLKTAVLYDANKRYGKAPLRSAIGGTTEERQYIRQMCAEIQQSVIDVLIKKTTNAAINYKVKTIILGGGVTANKELRKQFAEKIKKNLPNTRYLMPSTQLCTDNALMVAIAGYFKYKTGKKENWKDIEVNANLGIQ